MTDRELDQHHTSQREELEEAHQRLSFHVDNSPLAVVEWNARFLVTRWSGEAEKMFGWTAADTIGKPIADLHMFYEDDLPLVHRTMKRLSAGNEQSVVSSNRNYTKNGRVLHCVWYNSVLLDPQGRMSSVLSQVLDITERKQVEESLRSSEERLRSLYESMSEGVANHTIVYENGVAVDYIITDVNPAYERITGHAGSTVIGRRASELHGTGSPPFLEVFARVASSGASEKFETFYAPMQKHFVISVFSPGKGTFAAVFSDITDRKKREDELGRLNRTFKALSASNQAMTRAKNEQEYLSEVCRIVVHDCGHAMAWIGIAEDNEDKTVRPVASAGFEEGYLRNAPHYLGRC